MSGKWRSPGISIREPLRHLLMTNSCCWLARVITTGMAFGNARASEPARTRPDNVSSIPSTTNMTKAGEIRRANTLTNNTFPVLSARARFKARRLARMEIYRTISHVSTNQVWLHINSASSRVYFRPIALFSPSLRSNGLARGWPSAAAGQLARSYLPGIPLASTPSPRISLIPQSRSLSPFYDTHLLRSPYSPPAPGMPRYSINPLPLSLSLSYSSLERSYP